MSAHTISATLRPRSANPYFEIIAYPSSRARFVHQKLYYWAFPRLAQLHLALLINDGEGGTYKCDLQMGGVRVKELSIEALDYLKTAASFSDRIYISLIQLETLTQCIDKEQKKFFIPQSRLGNKSIFGGQKHNCATFIEDLLKSANISIDPVAFDKIVALPLLHVRTTRSKLFLCKDLITMCLLHTVAFRFLQTLRGRLGFS